MQIKAALVSWVESYLYTPSLLQRLISFLLYPLSLLYQILIIYKYKSAKVKDFGVKIVSVGNLVVGGSGKTPLVTALAKEFSKTKKVAIILRGYGRKSSGLQVVKDGKEILCSVDVSGDEAMIYAQKLANVVVIVSEDRVEGVEKAKSLGCNLLFLDDAYSKHNIKKLDFLIDVETKNNFFLPSGPYRDSFYKEKNVFTLVEGRDFKRVVSFQNRKERMSLVTAIARPQRLDTFLCEGVVKKHYFEDHHNFSYDEAQKIFEEDSVESLLVTYKDFVKLEKYGIPLSLMDLEVEVDDKIIKIVKDYIEKED